MVVLAFSPEAVCTHIFGWSYVQRARVGPVCSQLLMGSKKQHVQVLHELVFILDCPLLSGGDWGPVFGHPSQRRLAVHRVIVPPEQLAQ